MPTPSSTPPSLGCDARTPLDYSGKWVVLQTLPRHTKSTAWRLHENGIGYYLPMYETMELDSEGKKRVKVLPFYPGYVFANVADGDQQYTACGLFGVFNLIPIPNQFRFRHEMDEIHKASAVFDPNAAIREGVIVRVTAGPLMGYEGPVVQRLKSGQIRIYLHVFGTYRDVEIAPSVLEAVA